MHAGAIQVLRNAMGVGGMVYESAQINIMRRCTLQ